MILCRNPDYLFNKMHKMKELLKIELNISSRYNNVKMKPIRLKSLPDLQKFKKNAGIFKQSKKQKQA